MWHRETLRSVVPGEVGTWDLLACTLHLWVLGAVSADRRLLRQHLDIGS